jgi:hypothetical protein
MNRLRSSSEHQKLESASDDPKKSFTDRLRWNTLTRRIEVSGGVSSGGVTGPSEDAGGGGIPGGFSKASSSQGGTGPVS